MEGHPLQCFCIVFQRHFSQLIFFIMVEEVSLTLGTNLRCHSLALSKAYSVVCPLSYKLHLSCFKNLNLKIFERAKQTE